MHEISPTVKHALTRLEQNDPHWANLLSDDEQHSLTLNGYVIPDEYEEHTELMRERENQRLSPRGISLTIAPTIDCNFGCPYCFEGSDKPQERMNVDTMMAVASLARGLITPQKTEELSVTWFGGEPLLAMPQITQLTEILVNQVAKPQALQYSASMISNGYGLTPKVARKLVDLHVKSIQVTVDGTAEFHDLRRFRLGGHPTFDRIMQNVVDVHEIIRISIRVNLDRSNKDSFIPLVNHLHQLGLKDKVGIYPAFTRDAGDAGWSDSYESVQEYMKDQVTLHQQAVQHGSRILEYPSAVRLYCGASRPNFWVIHPNGDLHKCWDTINEHEQAVGNVHELEIDEAKLEHWEHWSPFNHEKCRQCNVMPLCMAGCAHKAFMTNGEPQCEQWKFGLHDAIRMWVAGQHNNLMLSERG